MAKFKKFRKLDNVQSAMASQASLAQNAKEVDAVSESKTVEMLFSDGCGLFQLDKATKQSGISIQSSEIHGGPTPKDLKDLLLTFWCQIPQNTFSCLLESGQPVCFHE